MIIKSFEIHKINKLKYSIFLLYGANEGLKEESISNFFTKEYKGNILKYDEQEVIKNEIDFIISLTNESLFDDKKLIIISRVTEKITSLITQLVEKKIKDIIIVLNCGILEKKSKLRNLFEKSNYLICIPFYEDNYKSLKIYIEKFIKDKKINISQEMINILIERSKGDRANLKNELIKIENLFQTKKNISNHDIQKITNLVGNYSIFELSDCYLIKNKKKIINILNENNFNNEDCILIIRTILNKTKKILKIKNELNKNNNINQVINSHKPPIFWKDQEIVKKQVESWSTKDVKNIIYKILDLEIQIKKNYNTSVNLLSDFVSNY